MKTDNGGGDPASVEFSKGMQNTPKEITTECGRTAENSTHSCA